jgi:ubiquinone/menaquinone biosynthesis C-methylase UbiE
MNANVSLRVLPSSPCELDFTWYELIREELLRLTVPEGSRVLDVGCGSGDVLRMLSAQIDCGVGIDWSEDAVAAAEKARERSGVRNIRFRVAGAVDLPCEDGEFDVALCLGDVLCYSNLFGKRDRVLAEIRRVLRSGGVAVHQCMNWDWEYRSSPRWTFFSCETDGAFVFHRVTRTAYGLETTRNYRVLPDSPVHKWIGRQEWPVSPQGAKTSLDVLEEEPIPKQCLRFTGVSRHQHFTLRSLRRAYRKAGFRDVEAFAYGQTYDIAAEAGLLDNLGAAAEKLARAEARLIMKHRTGSGPWLFLLARK